jgi:hypothetical protein
LRGDDDARARRNTRMANLVVATIFAEVAALHLLRERVAADRAGGAVLCDAIAADLKAHVRELVETIKAKKDPRGFDLLMELPEQLELVLKEIEALKR